MPGIAHASFQQKNYMIVYHILLSFFTQPEPIYSTYEPGAAATLSVITGRERPRKARPDGRLAAYPVIQPCAKDGSPGIGERSDAVLGRLCPATTVVNGREQCSNVEPLLLQSR